MAAHDTQLFGLQYLDTLSRQDTALHRLDPRAKVLTVCAFIIAVVSFGRYDISGLLPFFLFPAVMIRLGNLPAAYLARQILVLLPFALLIGIANPLFDRQALVGIGPFSVSGGWVSCGSILLRFALTAIAALILISTTGFIGICAVLERFGLPRVFTVQLLFIHRYIFVLIDEAGRMARARQMRSFNSRGMTLKAFSPLVGHLLLRTIDRAQRIYLAMVSRGFAGSIRFTSPLRFGRTDAVFTAGWTAVFIFMRLVNLPLIMGRAVEGLFR